MKISNAGIAGKPADCSRKNEGSRGVNMSDSYEFDNPCAGCGTAAETDCSSCGTSDDMGCAGCGTAAEMDCSGCGTSADAGCAGCGTAPAAPACGTDDGSNCASCGADCSDRTQPQITKKPLNQMSSVDNVIAVVSGKGGVGKSLITAMMAVIMRRRGFRTAILDADVTGPSIPKTFKVTENATANDVVIFPVETKTGIQLMSINLLLEDATDPVLWRGPVIAGAVEQFWTDVLWESIDYMFVDMPPGTGDVPLTVFQSLPIKGIIVVASPQELVGMIVEKAVKMAEMMDIPVLGIVENMSYFECPECHGKHEVFGKSHVEEIAKKFNIPNVARIPIDPKLSAAVDAGMIELFDGDWLDSFADKIELQMKEETAIN